MKRRRLHRHAKRFAFNPRQIQEEQPQAGIVPLHPQPSREQIMFERGIEHGMRLAHQAQASHMADVQRRALQAAQSEPFLVMARQNGYDEGYRAGLQANGVEPQSSNGQFSYADLERARRQGVEEGKRIAGGIPNTGEASRKKVLDEVMQEVRVISESNPNMSPGPFANALKHRLKKLY